MAIELHQHVQFAAKAGIPAVVRNTLSILFVKLVDFIFLTPMQMICLTGTCTRHPASNYSLHP